ncbi:DUF5954 family protein [Pseudomonas sp. MPB23]|uniref:DUF5954 family protein n=1 Tax=Pseudomonas sp. MPB23 TaxID=3388490 RepID=UPI0039851785
MGRAVALVQRLVFGTEFVQVELARVVHQFGHVQRDVRTAAAQADQAYRGKLLLAAQFAVAFRVGRAWEHHVA